MRKEKNYPKTTTREKYNNIIANFVTDLEKGVAPWTKSWSNSGGLPENFATGNQYNGMNILTLMNNSFNDNKYLTYNQVKQLDGTVKKGSKSTPIFFMKPIEKEEINSDTGETEIKKSFVMQSYNVFNIEQTEGIDYKKQEPKQKNEIIQEAQEFIDTIGIDEFVGNPAYSPSDDCIFMPNINSFEDKFNYYSTYLHELSHATGHPNRLNREESQHSKFGDPNYAFEELIAEMSSAFLCAELNVDMKTTRHTEYLNSWIHILKVKPQILFSITSKASKSANYLKDIVANKTQQKEQEQVKTKSFSPKM